MNKLQQLLNLPSQVEALERKIKLLTAYMQAEAHFRKQAREALLTDLPLQERHNKALGILASYESAVKAVFLGSTLIYPTEPTVPDPRPCIIHGEEDDVHVVFYGDSKETTV